MENIVSNSNMLNYGLPIVSVGIAYTLATPANVGRDVLIALGLSLAGVYFLKKTYSADIDNFLQDRRRSGIKYQYSDDANPTLTNNGIADVKPVLPTPTASIEEANVIELPNQNLLLVPAPSDISLAPMDKIIYGVPAGVDISQGNSAIM